MTNIPNEDGTSTDAGLQRDDSLRSDQRIILTGVDKCYGELTALDSIDLQIHPGTFHGLIGPNGSGKTTLFRLISGLSNPTSGEITRSAGGIGYSFQEPRFFPDLTVRENIKVFRSLDDDPEPMEWVETLLSELRLERATHRRARDISGGFRKKLDLALALLSRPKFLLLDEPLADVDPYSRRQIVSFLDDYCDSDRSILVSSHNASSFEEQYDRITILLDGRVLADGAPNSTSITEYREQYG